MALTIEDGSIVTGADSYVTREEYIAYALNLGVVIADDDDTDVQLRKAADFIGSHEARLKGSKVARGQPLAYPRSGLVLEGFTWDSDELPRQVLLCQMQIALDINEGIDPYNPPPSESTPIRRERIEGAVEVEYALGDQSKVSRKSTSQALLMVLLRNNGLRLVRG